jgi:hypothetical protein
VRTDAEELGRRAPPVKVAEGATLGASEAAVAVTPGAARPVTGVPSGKVADPLPLTLGAGRAAWDSGAAATPSTSPDGA